MSYLDPVAATWRLCHPVNIYVFKNGVASEKPQLVHIPMDKKKNMKTVLESIASRMKLTVGYPIALYDMDGSRICKTYELQMYRYYVVVTNMEKRFKCVDYGRIKEPLVVIGHHSKHVNTLREQNKRYDLFCRTKFRRRLHEMMPHGERNGLGPEELPPSGPPCGTLCTKIRPMMNVLPTQVCSDEIMCVQEEYNQKRMSNSRPDMPEYQCHTGSKGQLMELILRYQDVGSQIFKMFQDRMGNDLDNSGERTESKWGLPGDGTEENASLVKVQEELRRLAQASCQLNNGNFVSQGCPVNIGSETVAAARSMINEENICEP